MSPSSREKRGNRILEELSGDKIEEGRFGRGRYKGLAIELKEASIEDLRGIAAVFALGQRQEQQGKRSCIAFVLGLQFSLGFWLLSPGFRARSDRSDLLFCVTCGRHEGRDNSSGKRYYLAWPC